ncbi:hypothetical protein BG003_008486 [Podila horticola]|nr:hypothetical protein BG003_008486 [Podila horticola]
MDVDNDEGYYYTGQAPFRKQNESKLHFHARRLISIQTLGRLEYTVEEAETKFNRALGPVELTFVGLEPLARDGWDGMDYGLLGGAQKEKLIRITQRYVGTYSFTCILYE